MSQPRLQGLVALPWERSKSRSRRYRLLIIGNTMHHRLFLSLFVTHSSDSSGWFSQTCVTFLDPAVRFIWYLTLSVHAVYFADNLFETEREPVNAKIYVHGDLEWNDFKIMICRSTTPDMVKMVAKIQEFLAQQHRNGIRALSSLRPHAPLTMGDVMSSLSSPVASNSQASAKEGNTDG